MLRSKRVLQPLFYFIAPAACLFLASAPAAAQQSEITGQPAVAQEAVDQSAEPFPIIEFEHREYDLGRQLAGGKLHHTFIVYNKGTADLHIKSVKSG